MWGVFNRHIEDTKMEDEREEKNRLAGYRSQSQRNFG